MRWTGFDTMSLNTPVDAFVPKRGVYNKDDLKKYYEDALDSCQDHYRKLSYGNPWIKDKADDLRCRQIRAINNWRRDQCAFMRRVYGDEYI